jgi:redox-sensitive bicupin YhaK (pirin superfamily)
MLRHVDSKKMGHAVHSWLDTLHHFSFAGYYNPDNMNFGNLRVVNDDLVKPSKGFDIHPHRDMEIISYVVEGELTHGDSMGNKSTLKRGEVQYMSAGTGVFHSEHNFGEKTLRFLQIWILPDKENHKPDYGDYKFNWEDRENKWLAIASGDKKSKAPIKIHADMNVYAAEISKDKELKFEVKEGRQAYMVLIEGGAKIGKISLSQRDALEIVEEDIIVKTASKAHCIVFEMEKAEQLDYV